MTPEPQRPGEQPETPSIAPYYPPSHPPPAYRPGTRSDGRGIASLICGVAGVLLSPTGIASLVLGPIAYFLGKSAQARIEEARGALSGHGTASAGWILGVVATALGAVVTLVYFILFLVQVSGPSY